MARAKRSRSKSRPMTAAIESTRPASLRQVARPVAPITSRTLSGRAICSREHFGHPSPGGVLVDRPGLGQMAQHLAHEERVAVGLAIHRVGKAHPGVIEGVTGGGLHERHHPAVVESRLVRCGRRRCVGGARPGSRVRAWDRDNSLSR